MECLGVRTFTAMCEALLSCESRDRQCRPDTQRVTSWAILDLYTCDVHQLQHPAWDVGRNCSATNATWTNATTCAARIVGSKNAKPPCSSAPQWDPSGSSPRKKGRSRQAVGSKSLGPNSSPNHAGSSYLGWLGGYVVLISNNYCQAGACFNQLTEAGSK